MNNCQNKFIRREEIIFFKMWNIIILFLSSIERQREEKREQQIKDYESTQRGADTWADKFSNDYKPARLPDQPPETLRREDVGAGVETTRISSAPVNVGQSQQEDDEDKCVFWVFLTGRLLV